MESLNSGKIKKYLFFISIVFLLVILSHLLYIYLYSDAETTPIKGGNISEGILSSTININPFSHTNEDTKSILSLTYRSLMKYNPETKNFEKDLATCDIKNLKNIECYVDSGEKWSDDSEITIDDVYKTYSRLKELESEQTIYPFLKDISLSKTENKIVFSSENSDINHIKILLQYIVPGDIVESMTRAEISGTISNPAKFLYSGPYTISDITNDETTGIRSVILVRNKKFTDRSYHIDKISFRFFKTPSDILKYKSMINVFNDTENILGEYSPRIQTFEYKLPKITSIFVNADKIEDKDLRAYILEKINRDAIIEAVGKNFTKVMNPFASPADTSIENANKDLGSLVAEYEYYSKSTIVDYLLTDEQKEIIAAEEKENYKENPDLEYQLQGITKQFTFLEDDNILLEGKVDEGTVAVYFNDYKLTGFSEGDNKFFYRLEEKSYETIEKGVNDYELIFEDAEGNKKTKTKFIVAYNPDAEILKSYKDDLLALEDDKTYTGEAELPELSDEEIALKKKLDALEDNFFYDRELKKFSLSLAYITGDQNIEKTAMIIKGTLEGFGISVELKPISASKLAANLEEGKNDYDMILAGLSLGYFNFDLFPYLHSSQSKNAYNLANFEKSTLDEAVELLREKNLNEQDRKKQKDSIIKILQEEQIMKSIYQPNEKLLVDKNIKNFKFWDYLPNYRERMNYMKGIYTLEQKEPLYETKSFGGFIGFLFSQLF